MKLTDFLNQHSITIDVDPHEFKFVIDNSDLGKEFQVIVTHNDESIAMPFYTTIDETRKDVLEMFWKEIKGVAVPFYKTESYQEWCEAMLLKADDEINRTTWQVTGDYLEKLEYFLGEDLFMDLLFQTEE